LCCVVCMYMYCVCIVLYCIVLYCIVLCCADLTGECKRHGIKEKRTSSWWSNLAGAAGDRPAGMKKSTAEDFMKMAVLVAKHRKGGEAQADHSKTKKIIL
jgi:hypothetical protein